MIAHIGRGGGHCITKGGEFGGVTASAQQQATGDQQDGETRGGGEPDRLAPPRAATDRRAGEQELGLQIAGQGTAANLGREGTVESLLLSEPAAQFRVALSEGKRVLELWIMGIGAVWTIGP